MTEREDVLAQSEEAEEVKENKEAPSPEKEEKGQKKEASKQKAELAAAKEELKKAKEELDALNDKYLRLAAEYDNFRRRSVKEKEGIYSDAVSDIIKEVLPIFDNLERAAIYESAEKVAEGLAITAKSIDTVLAKAGIEKFGAAGETFDPNLHNAVLHIEDETLPENVIAEVFQTGYRLKDRVIRYAMVKVAN